MATKERFGLDELYHAYRKAKHYAFRDPNSAQGLLYADYEEELSKNLRSLFARLNRKSVSVDASFTGGWSAIPRWSDGAQPVRHFYSSDPKLMWELSKPDLQHRVIGTPSVNMQVVNALWCMTAGARMDATLNHAHVFASHPHRGAMKTFASGVRISTSRPLFQYWPEQYAKWQRQGLRHMRMALREGRQIVAITMDVKSFYHRLDATFLTAEDFLAHDGVPAIRFSKAESWLNRFLLAAIRRWLAQNPDGSDVGLPVGWTASAVLANASLRSFDQRVLRELSPIYYGRYVDDVFLVAEPHQPFAKASETMAWLSKKLQLAHDEPNHVWRLDLPGLGKSQVEFGEKKQKIFCLDGEAGLDLVRPIEDAIRRRGSEFRALPALPTDDDRLAASALLTTPDATIEADAIRKADAISVRRHGFSLLLKRVGEYREHIEPSSWTKHRRAFFGVVRRHLLTPRGLVELGGYIPRVFAVAASTGDWATLLYWIREIDHVCAYMDKKAPSAELQLAWKNLWAKLAEAVVVGASSPDCDKAPAIFRKLLARSGQIERDFAATWMMLARADWLIRPRLLSQELRQGNAKRWPRQLVSKGVEVLRRNSTGPLFSTDAMMLATRVPEPAALYRLDVGREDDFEAIASALALLKYGRRLNGALRKSSGRIHVGGGAKGRVRLFAASLQTYESEWRAATHDRPVLTATRFDNLRRLFDRVIDDAAHARDGLPSYLLLPELSLPQRWASFFAGKLAAIGMSLVAGLEYRRSERNEVVNEALLSLAIQGWGRRSVVLLQRKRRPAWREAQEVQRAVGLPFAKSDRRLPVYVHGDLHLSVVICSDFTDVRARARLQGAVDLVVVPEWNMDVDSFSTLTEAAALDLHCFIAQINNRAFGDSLVRVAAAERWKRELVRLRGGRDDFYATVDVDYHKLRQFQSNAEPPEVDFKPFPVGFKLRKSRRKI